jgi:hypothetical protein
MLWANIKFLKKTKSNNWKIMQSRVIILNCTALVNMIYPPMKFQFDTSNIFWDNYALDKNVGGMAPYFFK